MAVIPGQSRAASRRAKGCRGFSIVEAVLSVLIVSVMLVAVLNTFGGMAKARKIRSDADTASALGLALISEVIQARYEDPQTPGGWGRETGEGSTTRADFDDLDDYDGWSDSPPQTKDGTVLSEYGGYTRSVVVSLIDPISLTPIGGFSLDKGLRKVQVTVTDSTGKTTEFFAFRASKGVGEQIPVQDTTNVTWVGVDLQVTGGKYTQGANLVNLPPAQ